MRLLTRSDFDGLVCAVLLVEQGLVDDYEFVEVQVECSGEAVKLLARRLVPRDRAAMLHARTEPQDERDGRQAEQARGQSQGVDDAPAHGTAAADSHHDRDGPCDRGTTEDRRHQHEMAAPDSIEDRAPSEVEEQERLAPEAEQESDEGCGTRQRDPRQPVGGRRLSGARGGVPRDGGRAAALALRVAVG